MDVRSRRAGKRHATGPRRTPPRISLGRTPDRGLDEERVGEALGEWQHEELRVAHAFAECRDLSTEQLEDIYQETVLALLERAYRNEEHLRGALRTGLRHRALHVHRDERRRADILIDNAPGQEILARSRAEQDAPEQLALAAQDRAIVTEFLTELSALEQSVFMLIADGLRHRNIALALGMETNEARRTVRACEQKRERFQILYDTGRLCGFRAATILALQRGEATSSELAERAFAHLAGCAHCRSVHHTSAQRLRASFHGQAAGLLPLPALSGGLRWLTRRGLRAHLSLQRLFPAGTPSDGGNTRERLAALIAGAGISAKVTATAATVVVIAGGALGATHVLAHHARPPAARAPRPPVRSVAAHAPAVGPASSIPAATGRATTAGLQRPAAVHSTLGGATHTIGEKARPVRTKARRGPGGLGHARPKPDAVAPHSTTAQPEAHIAQHEPGGFAYLGVPTEASAPASPAPAQASAQSTGGPFSP